MGGSAHAVLFRINVTNLGGQPLSPMFFSASNSSFDIFQVGGTATNGIKRIAEGGNTAPQIQLAADAGSAVAAYGRVGNAPITTGGGYSILFDTDETHGIFSFAAMLGHTNDGWIGESASSANLQLFTNGNANKLDWIVTGRKAWDAGTEKNTQSSADLGFLGGSGNPAEDAADGPNFGKIRTHGGVIDGLNQSAQMETWHLDSQIAHITVEPVPEPASMVALGIGALALLRRKNKKS